MEVAPGLLTEMGQGKRFENSLERQTATFEDHEEDDTHNGGLILTLS
jgi:hypothetical protein